MSSTPGTSPVIPLQIPRIPSELNIGPGAHEPTPIYIYSLWLLPLPSSPSATRIEKLMRELRTEEKWETKGDPDFEGHVTLCGGMRMDLPVDGKEGLGGKVGEVLKRWSEERGGEGGDAVGKGKLVLEMEDPVALGTYHTSLVHPVRTDFPFPTSTPGPTSLDSVPARAPPSIGSYDLLTLNNLLSTSLPLLYPPSPAHPFYPHLSIAYTSLSLATRESIAQRLKTEERGMILSPSGVERDDDDGVNGGPVEFGRVALVKCEGSVWDGGWKEVKRWHLDGREVGIGE